MSTEQASGQSVDESIQTMLLLMPRVVGRIKRMAMPSELRSFSLAPRHLSLLAYLLFHGPMGVNDLAERLGVAPTTVSLMVGELSRCGVVQRREDDNDRRRTIVSIAPAHHDAVDAWLSKAFSAWRTALEPLTPEERATFVRTFETYARELSCDGC